jgi:hypothetical protein
MKTTRATLHMRLATYLSDNPDEQVVKMATRVAKKTISKRTKRTMKTIIDSPYPAELVKRVYDEVF